MKKSLAIYSTLTVLMLGALAVFSFPISAATALETVVGECKQRTGFGDATCKTLVKKYMNVERCKEYTGYSDEECAKKIEEIKKDPEFSGGQSVPNAPSSSPTSETPALRSRNTSTLSSVREKKERDLLALWKRTEAVTNILKSKGADTSAIESVFPEFQARAEELLAAYDAYIAVYERTKRDTPTARQSVRLDARGRINQAQRALIEHYQTRILAPLRIAREKTL